MTTRDIFTDLAAIRHPFTPDPDPEGTTAAYDAWCKEIAEDRRRDAEQLRRSCAENDDADPLLTCLRRAQRAKEDAEAEIRRLLAYGREFVRPRGYTLEALAKATSMSISGVRTAYWPVDVETVAKATGAKPRDWRAPEPAEPSPRPDRTYNYAGDPIPDRTLVNYMGDRVQVVDDRDPVDILAAADDFLADHPDARETQVADELGITVSRLRLLRQHFGTGS
jgi:hypothetical protein